MKLYTEKLRIIRKNKKISSQELAQKMGITRLTLCAWENNKRIPSEAKIRMIAKSLDIPVEEISDIKSEKPKSESNIFKTVSTMVSLLGTDRKKNKERMASVINGIAAMNKELSDARLIIEVILSSSLPSLFYIKDSNLHYISANESFLKNLSLDKNFSVFGKTDSDFFPQHEAKINYDMDRKVLSEGKPLLDIEGYIPGSRKTKWGIISKSPVFDSDGKIAGVVGSFVDITKRKIAEELREILEDNINAWQNCMTIWDITEQKYVFVSKVIEKITGYPAEKFYNIPKFHYETCLHPDDRKIVAPYVGKLSDEYLIITYRIIRADGQIRRIASEIFPGKKEFLSKYSIAISEDITDKV
ncbi:MAG TPA: hypothetical protein DD381_08660 [Lentisphaeria bacterium]|nr:MAG: hypothetical protein A2X47_08185 [Lentisphaerae bacterium GWF2_38_69]HBM16394.1 hypothetical protein [Lentisphaeria bacterium]